MPCRLCVDRKVAAMGENPCEHHCLDSTVSELFTPDPDPVILMLWGDPREDPVASKKGLGSDIPSQ